MRDAAGNTTTVRLSYHLVSSHVPGVVVTPDPGTDPNPRPGDDPLNPKPRPVDPATPPRVDPDGTQHAVIEDEMRVKVKDGAQLTLADARSLMERRYAFTPEGGGAVTELKLALADGAGNAVSAIDLGRPGAWRITYKVADASGNTITVNLRYVVVTDAPTVTPMPDPERPGVGPGGQPLPPGETNVDPETGLTHTVVTDHVVTRTSDLLLTPEAMAEFIDARYDLAPGSSGGGTAPLSVVLTAASARARASTAAFSGITASEVRLFNAAGAPALVIDCSEPGVWYAEQVFSDSFGDTTTLKLTYELREGNVQGGISDGSNGGSNGGTGNVSVSEAGPLTGDGSGLGRSRWASAIHQLPQTGGILGPCPLHIMFVLIMVLSGAYTLMRLRQESSGREERRRRDAEWEEFRREAVR